MKSDSPPHRPSRGQSENAWLRQDRSERRVMMLLPTLLGLAVLSALSVILYALSAR